MIQLGFRTSFSGGDGKSDRIARASSVTRRSAGVRPSPERPVTQRVEAPSDRERRDRDFKPECLG